MGYIADKIKNNPPVKVKAFLPQSGYETIRFLEGPIEDSPNPIEIVCPCQMQSITCSLLEFVQPLSLMAVHLPRKIVAIGNYCWWLSAGICHRCHTLYWRLDSTKDFAEGNHRIKSIQNKL